MKKYLKTFIVDSIFLTFIYFFVVVSKTYIESFFEKAKDYEAQLVTFNPDLTNQSVEVIAKMDSVIANFSDYVFVTLIVVLVGIPILFYLLVTVSQALNLSFLRNKFEYATILKSVLIGAPMLILFLIFEGLMTTVYVQFLELSANFLFSLIVLSIVLISTYIWYNLTILLLLKKRLTKYCFKPMYKNFFKIFPVFVLGVSLMFLAVSVSMFTAFRYLTDSFVGGSLASLLLVMVVLLIPIQFVRVWYFNLVQKTSK
jgi:hypothetical protein